MGLLNQFQSLNDVDLSRLNDRVVDLRQQIQDALALKEKLANEQATAQGAKAAASSTQTVASSTSPDDLIAALTTAQKRAK